MANIDVNKQATMKGLVELTDLDVANMSDESVKQMLMDLREFGLVMLNNSRINNLTPDEACRTLLDVRNLQRRRTS